MERDEIRNLYTVQQAADALGVSASTIWRWINARKLPALRIGPKAIRIRKQDVDAAVQPMPGTGAPARQHVVLTDNGVVIVPLTREEREASLAALADAQRLGERILKRRKGKLLPDSTPLIRAARAQRPRMR